MASAAIRPAYRRPWAATTAVARVDVELKVSPREALVHAAAARGDSLTTLSLMLGRNAAYLQQYIQRGSPRRLDEDDRRTLAMHLGIDERSLGARDPWSPYG